MLTLYTAVGSLQFVNVNGKPVPHVINNQKEYGMSKEELLVWSCLAFQILTYPELERLFEKNCADSGQSISLPLSTAELLLSMERGILIRKEEDILEKLYTSPEDTCSTLTDTVQITHAQYPILQAVSNLYLNQKILFQKI